MQGRSLIFGAVLLLAGGRVLAAADQVAFRFAPPAGKTWRETSKVKTAIPIPRRDLRRVTETETVSRIASARAGELSATVVSATNKLEDKVMESPLYQILPGLTLTFKVGPDGQILDMVDFPKLLDQVRKSVPPERFEQVTPFFTSEALLGRRRAASNPLVGLAGKTLAVGSTTAIPGTIQLPNGESFPVRFTVTLKGKEPAPACPGCIRVDFTTAPVLQTGKPADIGATGSGTALIDPATLLTWSLKHEETVVMEEPGSPATRMQVGLNVESSLAPEK
jgi:hypothetical protein